MNIMLIHPPTPEESLGEDLFFMEPLALEYWGAVLDKKGHTLSLVDMRFKKSLEDELENNNPSVITIFSSTIHIGKVKELVSKIKELGPEIKIIITSPHAAIDHTVFAYPGVDVICIRDTGEIIENLMDALEKGSPLKDIPGIGFADQDGFTLTAQPTALPAEDTLFPKRDLMTKEERACYFCEWQSPLSVVRLATGGAYLCDIGSHWKTWAFEKKTREVDDIVKELKTIDDTFIYFMDAEPFLQEKKCADLFNAIVEAGIEKQLIIKLDKDMLLNNFDIVEAGKKAGLFRVFIELDYDSENQEEQKRMLAENKEVIEKLDKLEITIHPYYTIPCNWELDDYDNFIKFANEISVVSPRYYVQTPEPTDESIIEKNTAFYDHFHAIVKTKLAKKRFYPEIYFVYNKTILPRNRKFVKNFEDPKIFSYYHHFLKGLKKAFLLQGSDW